MRLFLFKNSVSVYLYKLRGRIRRFIGGDNALNKVRDDRSLRDDFAFNYKGYKGVAICVSRYSKTYTCTIRNTDDISIVYGQGETFTDLAADFIRIVDLDIKENKGNERIS